MATWEASSESGSHIYHGSEVHLNLQVSFVYTPVTDSLHCPLPTLS